MIEDRTAELEATGTRIAHYEILEYIGQGGMGVVYRARDVNLGRQVALKRPLSPLTDHPKVRDRFHREARAASRLQHPSIVTIFEVFEENGQDWMAMEFVDGRSLGELIARDGPMTSRELLRHAEGLSDALREAHAHRVIHRDIKPSNILVDRKGLARLTDFGLARFQESLEDSDDEPTASMPITEVGKVVGTAAYMSPEQTLGKKLDGRSDIFSLGAVLYEMCTARAAFAEESKGQILDSILHRDPRAISALNPGTTDEIIRIIAKCIAKRADERYQSADELLTDVRAERRRLQGSDYASSHPAQELAGAPKFSWALLAAIGLTALALSAIAGYLWLKPQGSPIPPSTPRQITALPGWEADVAISPDGGFLAYASNESGNVDIWVIDVRGGDALQLTAHPAPDRSPAWYPDGSAIVFHSERRDGTGIWKVPRLGGAPTMLIESGREPDMSPDGSRLAFARRIAADDTRIVVASLDDPTQVEILTKPGDGVWTQANPAWSPDGQWICYNGFRDLWLVPAGGGEARRLTTDASGSWEPAWSPSGRYIYFSSGREGTVALWRIPASGGTPQRITVGTGPEVFPSISGDGSILAYTTFVQDLDPVLIDLEKNISTRQRGARADWGGRFAPANSGFVFVSDRAGADSLWWQPLVDGRPSAAPLRLNDERGESANPAISPDGQWVAYQQRVGRDAHIAVLPLATGLSTAFTEGPGLFIHPAWSPSGSEIAYLEEHDDFTELWIRPVAAGRPAGQARRLPTNGLTLFWPQWSPDGESIAILAAREESWDLWMTAADGSSRPRQLTHGAEMLQITWIHETGELYASGNWGEQAITVRRVDPVTGEAEPTPWPFDFGHAAVYGDFEIADDSSLALYTLEEVRGDLWVLEGSRGAF